MIPTLMLFTISFVAASSPASTTKSTVDIFPLSTAIPSITPSMNFIVPTKTPMSAEENDHAASWQSTSPLVLPRLHDSALESTFPADDDEEPQIYYSKASRKSHSTITTSGLSLGSTTKKAIMTAVAEDMSGWQFATTSAKIHASAQEDNDDEVMGAHSTPTSTHMSTDASDDGDAEATSAQPCNCPCSCPAVKSVAVPTYTSAEDDEDFETTSMSTPVPKSSRASVKSVAIPPSAYGDDNPDDEGDAPTATMRHTSSLSRYVAAEGTPTTTDPSSSEASVQKITRLWHPATSNAKKLGIPKLFLSLFSLRAVVVSAQILPRADPSSAITSAPIPTSYTLRPTSIFDPPPPPQGLLTCPDNQERCGNAICFDSRAQWCCPGKKNLCNIGEKCAEAKVEEGKVVYGCAPADATDAFDSRIRTTDSGTGAASVSATASTTSTVSTSGNAPPTHTSSSGSKMHAPSIVRCLVGLMNSVRALAAPSPESCHRTGCPKGEICVNSSDGPKCWPVAAHSAVAEVAAEAATPTDVSDNDVHTNEVEDDDRKVPRVRKDMGASPSDEVPQGDNTTAILVESEDVERKKGGKFAGAGLAAAHGAGDKLTVIALHVVAVAGLASLVHRWF